MSSSVSLKPQPKQRAHRKASKPLMERRRRARINACLAQLHALLTQARATQTCRHSRLEKADILELTVRYLKSLTSKNTEATRWSRFCSGYTDCAREVSRFLSISGGHPTAFLHPLTEKLSAVNTRTVDNVCFDHQFNSKWPLPALCKTGKPCTPGIAEGPLRSAADPVCSQGLLQRAHSADTTSARAPEPAVEPAVTSMMKREYKLGPGGIEVWRPW